MNLIKKSEFGRLFGITGAGVGKLIKQKKIPVVGEGHKSKIDLDDAKIIAYLYGRGVVVEKTDERGKFNVSKRVVEEQEQNGAGVPAEKKTSEKQKTILQIKEDMLCEPKPIKTINPEGKQAPKVQTRPLEYDDVELSDEEIEAIPDGHLDRLPKEILDCIQKAEKIKLDRLKYRQARGELIERSFVEKLFREIYNIDVNEFLQLAAALSAKVSDVFACDDPGRLMKSNEVIDKELHVTQSHIKRKIDEYLNKLEKE